MFTFEIERKPVFFLCKLVFGGRKKVFFLCGKQCGYGSQALFGFRTSVVRVPHKRCSYSVQAFCELKRFFLACFLYVYVILSIYILVYLSALCFWLSVLVSALLLLTMLWRKVC